jgi:hypothetical protein
VPKNVSMLGLIPIFFFIQSLCCVFGRWTRGAVYTGSR